ncbi:hypothetical protein PENTCL1PPCAC_12718, partial [Pristionchus entomophagus]
QNILATARLDSFTGAINAAIARRGLKWSIRNTGQIELGQFNKPFDYIFEYVDYAIRKRGNFCVALHFCPKDRQECHIFEAEINSKTCPQSLQIGLYLAFGITAMLCVILFVSVVVFISLRFFKKTPVEAQKPSGIHLRPL